MWLRGVAGDGVSKGVLGGEGRVRGGRCGSWRGG